MLEAGSATGGATAIPVAAPAATKGPAYPTSNKKQTNWAALDREIEHELKDDKPEGD